MCNIFSHAHIYEYAYENLDSEMVIQFVYMNFTFFYNEFFL